MALGKERLGSYIPKMANAGDYPVVTDSGTVAEGETIMEFMPITREADGTVKAATAETLGNVYGLAATNAAAGEEAVYYLTGEFFASAIVLPNTATLEAVKQALRKICIFLK